MTMVTKLMNSGVTPCTTCKSSGRKMLTVVWAMPPKNSTIRPSPTGEKIENVPVG